MPVAAEPLQSWTGNIAFDVNNAEVKECVLEHVETHQHLTLGQTQRVPIS